MSKRLNGCLSIKENINVPNFVTLFIVLHYACSDGLYFFDVEPKTEAVPLFWAPYIHPDTCAFVGFGPVRIPDKAPITFSRHLLPFTLVRKLNLEWPVRYISWYHFMCP